MHTWMFGRNMASAIAGATMEAVRTKCCRHLQHTTSGTIPAGVGNAGAYGRGTCRKSCKEYRGARNSLGRLGPQETSSPLCNLCPYPSPTPEYW